jgi:hypothetical protein
LPDPSVLDPEIRCHPTTGSGQCDVKRILYYFKRVA